MLFVDSGAWLAWFHRRDQYHEIGVEVWKDVEEHARPLATSSLVVAESLNLLARRLGNRFAAEAARSIYRSEKLTLLRPDEADEMKALAYFEKYADQKVGFTDCVSFALMRRHRMERAFTFDRHFAQAGFDVVPGAFPGGAAGWIAETVEPYGEPG
jgi:predicted nucleic acid-binding protein